MPLAATLRENKKFSETMVVWLAGTTARTTADL
jgi:hypothetical protein